MRTNFLCIFVLRNTSGPRVFVDSCSCCCGTPWTFLLTFIAQKLQSGQCPHDHVAHLHVCFNHGFVMVNVCCGPRSILMPDAKRRALISTEGCNKR